MEEGFTDEDRKRLGLPLKQGKSAVEMSDEARQVKKLRVLQTIAIFMLLWALMDNPYSYYQVLRWVVCGIAGYSSYLAYQSKQIGWVWAFGVAAILYNPIAPIYFERETWSILNLSAVALFSCFIIVGLHKNNHS